MNCPQCKSILLVEVFGNSSPIRCASCGSVTMPTNPKSTVVNRYAWRSLWLGLSSILLLFLTGIPAIWYGVRSLLQMRFVRCQKNDRKAAAAGVALGVLFGIFATGVVAVVGGLFIMTIMMIEETKDPKRMEELLASIGSIDVPDDFRRIEANGFHGQVMAINWKDGTKVEDAQARARLISANQRTPGGKVTLSQSRDDFELHNRIEVDSENKQIEKLSWMFAGQNREVEKTIEAALEGDFNTIRYQAKKSEEEEKLGYTLIVSIRDPGKYSEEDVQKIFESFVPKE